jgi:hypothetical protein
VDLWIVGHSFSESLKDKDAEDYTEYSIQTDQGTFLRIKLIDQHNGNPDSKFQKRHI